MNVKNFFISFLMILLMVYPASPTVGVSLNRWVLNVTLHDDGLVEEVIQAEVENSGSLPLEGISFVVPASGVTMIYDFDHTFSFTGLVVEQQTVPGGVKVIINFNKSIETGAKWNGRIGFKAENWIVKEGSNYSINVPVEPPQAIVSVKNIEMTVSPGTEIRGQVFLPEGVNAVSVEPSVDAVTKKPAYKKLMQFDHVVLTWFQLHIGDVVSIKGSFSDILKQIVENDKKLRELSARINEAKEQGRDVSEAELHLKNAVDYNTNQALQSFWKEDDEVALQFVGYAKDELRLAENGLSTGGTKETPRATETKKTPGFEIGVLVLILLIAFMLKREK